MKPKHYLLISFLIICGGTGCGRKCPPREDIPQYKIELQQPALHADTEYVVAGIKTSAIAGLYIGESVDTNWFHPKGSLTGVKVFEAMVMGKDTLAYRDTVGKWVIKNSKKAMEAMYQAIMRTSSLSHPTIDIQ